jgi:hypothetical protein
MRVLHEKSPGDMSPSELIRQHSAEKNKEDKRKEKKAKRKQSKSYRKYQERVQDYKEKRQQWLEKQAEENKKRREEGKVQIGKGEVISSKDTDATATAKGISNVASVVGGLAKLGGKAIASRMQKKKEEAEKAAEAKKAGEKKAEEKAAETKATISQKLLPPGRSSEFEKTDKTSQRRPGTSRPLAPIPRPFTTGQRARISKRILPPAKYKASVGPMVKVSNSEPSSQNAPKDNVTSRPESLGQKARRNQGLKSQLIKTRVEEYSCWREDFLYELKDIRQKTKSKVTDKDPIIDIMKGKNKITIGPNVSESTETPQDKFDRRVAAAKLLKGQAKIKMLQYAASKYPKVNEELNTAAYMAKATPAITGRTKVMSDIHPSKQPGKGTAEMVRDRIRKLFLGDLKNYNPNYDFNGNTSDDNDVPNWSQDSPTNSTSASANESFEGHRHHSSGETTNVSNSSSEASARKRRATSAVMKAMAALNKDVEPKVKKKKKKKTEQ